MRRSRKTRTSVTRRRTKMSDLNVDVLQVVMNFLAQSSKGLQSLANAISTCKIFKEAAESKQVLRYVNVAYKDDSVCPNSIWNTRGILHKCARSGNRNALNMILQYTRKRIEFSRAKMEYIELVRQRLVEAFAAVEVVNTRARRREAQYAFEFYEEMKNDILQDHQEISDQCKTFETLQLL